MRRCITVALFFCFALCGCSTIPSNTQNPKQQVARTVAQTRSEGQVWFEVPSGTWHMVVNGVDTVVPASAVQVVSLFTGCSGTQYLGADGACHTAATGTGTVSAGNTNTIPKYTNGAGAVVGNSALTDNGTLLSYVGTGWISGATGPVFNAQTYGAVGDGSTANATAFAALATAVNAYTQHPTNAQGLTDLPTAYIPYGTYDYASGLNFTKPMILRCEPGTVLNYTGSAHEMDWGPTNLTGNTYQTTYFSIGCTWTGGASATQGIFVNPFVLYPRIWQNRFINNVAAAGFSVLINDQVDDPEVSESLFIDTDNAVHNGVKVASANGSTTNQLRFHDNICLAAMPPGTTNMEGGHAADNAGICLWSDGIKSQIKNNNLAWFQPDIRLGSNSLATEVSSNSLEASQAAVSTGVIQFGDPMGGNNTSALIEGLQIIGNEADLHSLNNFLVPTTTSAVLANAVVSRNTLSEAIDLSHTPVVQNNTAGQLNNKGSDNLISTGYSGFINIAAAGAQSNVPGWPNVGNICIGGAGGIGCPQFFSDTVNFDANLSRLSADTWAVGDNADGVGNVNGKMAMKAVETTSVAVSALPAAAAGNKGWIQSVSDSTAVAVEGQTCIGGSSNTALAFSNGTVWKCF